MSETGQENPEGRPFFEAGGEVSAMSGSVVDVRFSRGCLRVINTALNVLRDGPHDLALEAGHHPDRQTERCVAIQDIAGGARGTCFEDSAAPISAPAGEVVSRQPGRLPTRGGYQPTMATKIAGFEERIASVKGRR